MRGRYESNYVTIVNKIKKSTLSLGFITVCIFILCFMVLLERPGKCQRMLLNHTRLLSSLVRLGLVLSSILCLVYYIYAE